MLDIVKNLICEIEYEESLEESYRLGKLYAKIEKLGYELKNGKWVLKPTNIGERK